MSAVAVAGPRQAGMLISTLLVTKRAVLAFMRTPQLVIFAPLQMIGFLITFRYIFGGAIETGAGLGHGKGLSYVAFAVPGFIAAGVLFTTVGSAIAMAEDLQNGFIDRMRSLPMPRSAVLIGRVLADVVLLAWSLGLTALVGFAIGYRLTGSVMDGLAAFGLCLLFGLAFSWVFITLGLAVKDPRSAQSLVMLLFIVTFASSAYAPTETMPGWLRAFAENQPVTYIVETVRAFSLGAEAEAYLGHSASYYLSGALIWTAGILVVFFVMSMVIFRRNK